MAAGQSRHRTWIFVGDSRDRNSPLQPDKHDVEPRLGLAWRPFPASSTVIRAGYGVYYNTSVYQQIATQMAQQAPLSRSLSVANSPLIR